MPLPMPVLDHVVINVRDQLDSAQQLYQRLGFTMTPRGYHTLGSMNHLAVLGTEYIELIAARHGDTGRPEIMASPVGLNGIVFGTDDSASVHDALLEVGIPVMPPLRFSRPVDTATGTQDASFCTVRLPNDTTEAGRLYFCHHFTRELVWRDEWRHHSNGAIGIIRAVIGARDPAQLAGLFARMFGREALRGINGGISLSVGLASIDVVTPTELQLQFGTSVEFPAHRDEFMAALTIRVRGLDTAYSALRDIGAKREADRVIIPAAAAFGVVLELRA